MDSEWFVKIGRTWSGPHSSSVLKSLANSERLKSKDLVRKGESGNPIPAGQIKGLFRSQSSESSAKTLPNSIPPLPVPKTLPPDLPPLPSDDVIPLPAVTGDSQNEPKIWNPTVTIILSFIFFWGFGAFILARNWRKLGRPEREDFCMYWFYGWVIWFSTAILTEPDSSLKVLIYLAGQIIFTIIFVVFESQRLKDYLNQQFGGDYEHRSWGLPILVVFAVAMIMIGISEIWYLVAENE